MTVSPDIVLGAHFDSGVVLDYVRDGGGVVPAFTNPSTPAVVPGGKFGSCLEMGNPAANEGAEWRGSGLVSGLVQVGCIEFWVRPHYSGSPSTTQYFYVSTVLSSSVNRIEIYHNSSGGYRVYIRNTAGSIIASFTGAWAPTAEQWYHWEVDFDVSAGATRFFIDGTQIGATHAGTGTRSGTADSFGIGYVPGGSASSQNFDIDELLVWDVVQHTANFTPRATPEDLTYSVLANLSFEDPGSDGGVDAVDWPDVWLATATSATFVAGLFGSPSRWVESFEGRWSSNQDSIDAFIPATHLTQGIFGAWPYERIYDGFERDWSANEGALSSLGTGDVQAGAFDAAGDASEDFEEEWHSRHPVADVARLITPTAPDYTEAGSIARINEIKSIWNDHIADASVHLVADATNTITAPDATDLASLIVICEQMWNNKVWDHIVDAGLNWHRADSMYSLLKPGFASVITVFHEAWSVALLLTVACNEHFSWSDNSGVGRISALEDFSLAPASIYAFVVPGIWENFEAGWSSNDTALAAFDPGDISAGDFDTGGAPDQHDSFEAAISMNISGSPASAGTELSIDSSDGVVVSFGGTLSGELRLEARRKGYGTWLTISGVTGVPVDIDVDPGFQQIRIYTVTTGGAPTAAQKYRALDSL